MCGPGQGARPHLELTCCNRIDANPDAPVAASVAAVAAAAAAAAVAAAVPAPAVPAPAVPAAAVPAAAADSVLQKRPAAAQEGPGNRKKARAPGGHS